MVSSAIKKRGKFIPASGAPIIRMIINGILPNAYQVLHQWDSARRPRVNDDPVGDRHDGNFSLQQDGTSMGPDASSEPCRVGTVGSAIAPRASRRTVGLPGSDSHGDGVDKCLRVVPILSQAACLFPVRGGSGITTWHRDPQRQHHSAVRGTGLPKLGRLHPSGTAALAPPQRPYW